MKHMIMEYNKTNEVLFSKSDLGTYTLTVVVEEEEIIMLHDTCP